MCIRDSLTGEVEALSTVDINNTGFANGGNAGNWTLRLSGAANQTINSTVDLCQGALSKLVIDKTGGTVTMVGNVTVQRSIQMLQGTVDATGADLVLYGSTNSRYDNTRDVYLEGSLAVGNLHVWPYEHFNRGIEMAAGTEYTVNGTLTTYGNRLITWKNGTYHLRGMCCTKTAI